MPRSPKSAAGPTPTGIRIRLVGEMQIHRGADPLDLPNSRKTRALLAFLLITGRTFRREKLCDTFWDVADDPRGALRWSLSRIRSLVDEPGRARLIADRASVSIDVTDLDVDVLRLRASVRPSGVGGASVEHLVGWASAFRGELLEGLDLADFDDYQAWCVAEREEMRALRVAILRELVSRLHDQPDEALPHARAWTALDAYDVEARLATMRLALGSGRTAEAEQHFHAGRRVLSEIGDPRERAFIAAWSDIRRASHARPPTSHGDSARRSTREGDGARSGGAASRTSRNPAGGFSGPRLVGREVELERLIAALDTTARESAARVLILEGEPGIGKTRLVEAVRSNAERLGATVIASAAHEGESGRPYGPWIDALRAVAPLDAGRNDTSTALSALLPSPQADSPPGDGRDRLLAGVTDFVKSRAERPSGVLLALDDAQWLDPASAELLHFVVRACRHRRVFVLLAARRDELTDNLALARVLRSLGRDASVESVPLPRLDREAVAALLPDVPDRWDGIFARSGGNPLFALELARFTAAAGDVLPASVTEAVRERLLRLGAEAADVLRWAAVLGETFGLPQLERLIDLDPGDLVSALESLEAQALLVSTDDGSHYSFVHGVVRQAVYADLSRARARFMHRRLAESLRDQGRTDSAAIAELARHANLCGDAQLAVDAFAQAGERCLQVFANRQATSLAQRGLRHARTLPDEQRVAATVRLMGIDLRSRRPEERAPVKQELENLAREALALGCVSDARHAFWQLSYLFWEDGSGEAARRYMREAERISRSLDPSVRVESMADSGRCLLLLEHDLSEGSALLLEADARAKELDLELANIEDGLGMIARHQGAHDEAATRFEHAFELAQVGRDHAMAFYATEHALMTAVECGDLVRARFHLARAAELSPKLRDGSEAPYVAALGALLGHLADEVPSAALASAIEAFRRVDAKARLVFILTRAARSDLERGRLADATVRATEALELAEVLERPSDIVHCLGILARAHAARGDADGAGRYDSLLRARGTREVARSVVDFLDSPTS